MDVSAGSGVTFDEFLRDLGRLVTTVAAETEVKDIAYELTP